MMKIFKSYEILKVFKSYENFDFFFKLSNFPKFLNFTKFTNFTKFQNFFGKFCENLEILYEILKFFVNFVKFRNFWKIWSFLAIWLADWKWNLDSGWTTLKHRIDPLRLTRGELTLRYNKKVLFRPMSEKKNS